MKLGKDLDGRGWGVLATAGADGGVNTAVYAAPHVVGDDRVAWGMTEGRTRRNLAENPKASYLFVEGDGWRKGVRFSLVLEEVVTKGPLLEKIRQRAAATAGPTAAGAVKYVAIFRVAGTRPLVQPSGEAGRQGAGRRRSGKT